VHKLKFRDLIEKTSLLPGTVVEFLNGDQFKRIGKTVYKKSFGSRRWKSWGKDRIRYRTRYLLSHKWRTPGLPFDIACRIICAGFTDWQFYKKHEGIISTLKRKGDTLTARYEWNGYALELPGLDPIQEMRILTGLTRRLQGATVLFYSKKTPKIKRRRRRRRIKKPGMGANQAPTQKSSRNRKT